MKKNSKIRTLLCLCAALVCMLSLSVSAFAAEGCFASDETGNTVPPDAIETLTISQKDVSLKSDGSNAAFEIDPNAVDMADAMKSVLSLFGGNAFTPEGNLTLVDDIQQTESVDSNGVVHSKQFVTVQSTNGNYFYLVIDRSGETENVYVLNLVDEADLMALMEGGEVTPKTCTCKDKCVAGHVDTTCPICAANMTECTGKEAVQEQNDTDTEENKEEQQPEEKKSTNPALIIVLVLALGGGAAYYFLMVKKNQPKTKGNTDLNEYDFGEDDTEMEFEPYEEVPAESGGEAPEVNEGTDEE